MVKKLLKYHVSTKVIFINVVKFHMHTAFSPAESQIMMSVLLEYIDILFLPQTLCLVLLATYYAQNYASMISGCLYTHVALLFV